MHLALILTRVATINRPRMLLDPAGILAYLAILLIAVEAIQACQGRAAGRILGAATQLAYVGVWLAFADIYLRPPIEQGQWPSPLNGMLIAFLFGGAALRLTAAWRTCMGAWLSLPLRNA